MELGTHAIILSGHYWTSKIILQVIYSTSHGQFKFGSCIPVGVHGFGKVDTRYYSYIAAPRMVLARVVVIGNCSLVGLGIWAGNLTHQRGVPKPQGNSLRQIRDQVKIHFTTLCDMAIGRLRLTYRTRKRSAGAALVL